MNVVTADNPMRMLLDHILNTSPTQGMVDVIIQFKSAAMTPAPGALRRHADVEGVFEMLCMAQNGPNSKPFPLLNYFTADEVARVMVVREDLAPKIVPPPSAGGLIIPT